jgi:Tol biopolymer transport system component
VSVGPGQELLHYRLIEKLGEGGMGVVWKATDTTLDREVAIKILPDVFAQDAERLARFEREAKLLASLNHPNIAAVFSVHEAEDVRFLAMELVDGEDLAQRLSRGPLPREEVLKIAMQIAEALETAHENGIIHRDLKPANVVIGADGRVKVLDFGLAKAFDTESKPGDPAMSPTLTSAGTVAGMILGTAAYMSPEQARGQTVDKRGDIWALGCVMFEMLGGKMAFSGDTVSDTLASVLKLEPEWGSLPDDVPPRVRRLVERCLVKDPRQRLRDAGEARIIVDRALRGEDVADFGETARATTDTPGSRRSPVFYIVGLILVAVIAGAAGWLMKPTPAPESPLRRFVVSIPELRATYRRSPVISPDGRRIAYVANDRLWIRDLAELDAREVPQSEGARAHFWSWDGEHIAWIEGGKLWRAPAVGGNRTAICDVPGRVDGGAWSEEDRILLAPATGHLYEVSARGGDPRPFLEVDEEQETDFHKPHFLPDGRGVLYGVHRVGGTSSDTIEVFADGKRKVILRIEDHRLESAHYSKTGHIVYSRERGNDGVWALPFSLETLEATGEPVLIDPAGSTPSVSRNGSILYNQGSVGAERQLAWVDREGSELETIGQPQSGLIFPALSPDGRRVAIASDEEDSRDIWIHDVERGTRTRLTFDESGEWSPIWSVDGTHVFFTRDIGLNAHVFMKPVDGTGEAVEVGQGSIPSLSPDGGTLVLSRSTRENGTDVILVPVTGAGEESALLESPSSEGTGAVSPDGRYIAYTSDESGRREVYLKRFPGGEGKWQVSVDGGGWPRWGPSGDELLYVDEGTLMAVEIDLEPSVRLGAPTELFSQSRTDYDLGGPRQYDISPDGKRFLVVKNVVEVDNVPGLVFIDNWFASLRDDD